MEYDKEKSYIEKEEAIESSTEWENSLDSDGLPPADPKLVDKLVDQLKSNGIFDQIRNECMSEVSLMPAYQNLANRISEASKQFLGPQRWHPGINKNQIRNQLKHHIKLTPFMEDGINEIVEQVLSPKINSVVEPEVEKLIHFICNPDQQKTATLEEKECLVKNSCENDYNNNRKEVTITNNLKNQTSEIKVKKSSEFAELLKKSQEMMRNPKKEGNAARNHAERDHLRTQKEKDYEKRKVYEKSLERHADKKHRRDDKISKHSAHDRISMEKEKKVHTKKIEPAPTEELKEDIDDNTPLIYCVCRKEDDGTFMIGCNYCEEWYHPRCLSMSNERAKELEDIDWKCPKCEEKKNQKGQTTIPTLTPP